MKNFAFFLLCGLMLTLFTSYAEAQHHWRVFNAPKRSFRIIFPSDPPIVTTPTPITTPKPEPLDAFTELEALSNYVLTEVSDVCKKSVEQEKIFAINILEEMSLLNIKEDAPLQEHITKFREFVTNVENAEQNPNGSDELIKLAIEFNDIIKRYKVSIRTVPQSTEDIHFRELLRHNGLEQLALDNSERLMDFSSKMYKMLENKNYTAKKIFDLRFDVPDLPLLDN